MRWNILAEKLSLNRTQNTTRPHQHCHVLSQRLVRAMTLAAFGYSLPTKTHLQRPPSSYKPRPLAPSHPPLGSPHQPDFVPTDIRKAA